MSAFANKFHCGIRAAAVVLAVAATALVAAPAAKADFGFATFSVYVKASGGAANATGVKGAKRSGTGKYYVQFMRDVRNCVYVASVRGKSGGQVSIKPTPGNPSRLQFFTFSKTGSAKNQPFEVIVSCNY
ncbi:hypothetical protein [Microbaculum marinum]|uniref:Secreted protein n=1 Tax=Microbaculum marinum TaxID=1764581 RepID=A0AAW9RHE3_9HYPH